MSDAGLVAVTDGDLYRRGAETVVASWEAYARGSRTAAVIRAPGVVAAVFPSVPARGVYNNALLDRRLAPRARTRALDEMEAAYAAAGVDRFAAWVHESDKAMRADIEARGYTIDTTTLAMGMALDTIPAARPAIDLARPDWRAYVQYLDAVGVPPGLLDDVDPREFHVLIARRDGEHVATGLAFDLDGDCGIYNISTLEAHRRRGLGTALTALLLHDARDRGCRTASLQSTAMAERVYAAVGFRDLGRIVEYVPPTPAILRAFGTQGRPGSSSR
jgi:GNAT superfamily N-acetyltransferase